MDVSFPLDCCFCGLALGRKYQDLALQLAEDIAQQAKGVPFVVMTDDPRPFEKIPHVIALKHYHQFGYRPYNDKVFGIEQSLKRFSVVIQIDVDMRITQEVLTHLCKPWQPGITGCSQPLISHSQQYNRKDIPYLEKLGRKLHIDINQATWVGEAMFVVRRDQGKEQAFLKMWKKLAIYWDLHKLQSKDGTPIGLAAASVGWQVTDQYWQELDECLEHFDVHRQIIPNYWQKNWERWQYRRRLAFLRFSALKDPSFYVES